MWCLTAQHMNRSSLHTPLQHTKAIRLTNTPPHTMLPIANKRLKASSSRPSSMVLERSVMTNCELEDARLFGVWATKACLRGARCRGAKMNCAKLRDADLRDADLSRVDLSQANLRGAVLLG